MSKKSDVKLWTDKTVDWVREMYSKAGEIRPMVILYGKEIHVLDVGMLMNDEHKHSVKSFVSKFISDQKDKGNSIYASIFIAESWIYNFEGSNREEVEALFDKYGSVKNMPDSEECILISFESRDMQKQKHIKIKDGKILDETNWQESECEGKFVGFIEPDVYGYV
jgi:hypothetical protein